MLNFNSDPEDKVVVEALNSLMNTNCSVLLLLQLKFFYICFHIKFLTAATVFHFKFKFLGYKLRGALS